MNLEHLKERSIAIAAGGALVDKCEISKMTLEKIETNDG
jgi:hypothetical protein